MIKDQAIDIIRKHMQLIEDALAEEFEGLIDVYQGDERALERLDQWSYEIDQALAVLSAPTP